MATKQQRHREHRKAMGMCPREGCPEFTGGSLCLEHKRQHRQKVRKLRAVVKSDG